MAAIDRGETRTVICRYRGLYGNYSRKWLIFFLDLAPADLVLHHYVLFRGRVRIPITEGLVSASLRPPASPQEARHIGASGQYAAGGSMELVGQQIVSCKTTAGVLKFAVRRTDVPLLLHYITMKAHNPDPTIPVPQNVNLGTSLDQGFSVGGPREPDHNECEHD